VILVYPLLLLVALLIVQRGRGRGGAGWGGFAAWVAAGAAFTFSLLTGLSIGLFLLPVVVLAIAWAIRRAPDFRSMLGFVGGAGLILLVIAALHGAAIGWLVPGVALGGIALISFVAARGVDKHRTG
jgi:preprotein translocase subunit SecG